MHWSLPHLKRLCCHGGASACGRPAAITIQPACRTAATGVSRKSLSAAQQKQPHPPSALCTHNGVGWGDGRSTMHTLLPHTTPALNTSTHKHQNPAAPPHTQHTSLLHPPHNHRAAAGLQQPPSSGACAVPHIQPSLPAHSNRWTRQRNHNSQRQHALPCAKRAQCGCNVGQRWQ